MGVVVPAEQQTNYVPLPLPPPIGTVVGPQMAEIIKATASASALAAVPSDEALYPAIDCHNSIEGHPKTTAIYGDGGNLWQEQPDARHTTAAKTPEPPPARDPLSGLIALSTVQPEHVRWLWPGRIPLGKLTILDGDPGLGKSLMTADLAARVSSGRTMPDGTESDLDGAAGVVLLSAEDGLADTIRPRLDAVDADTTRIVALQFVIDGASERLPTLADLQDLERAIAACNAKLVVCDPLMAFLPGKVNAHSDQEVRQALTPLSKMAESTGVAVLVVRHLNKSSGGSPLYRGGGSIGIIGAARSGLLVAKDPDDESGARRILASTKCNLATLPPALAFRVGSMAGGVPYIIWEGATAHTASSLLSAPDDSEGGSAMSEAQDFLRSLLSDGRVAAEEVLREAKKAGISERTLHRAKHTAGIKPSREGFGAGGKWWWVLPSAADQETASAEDDIAF